MNGGSPGPEAGPTDPGFAGPAPSQPCRDVVTAQQAPGMPPREGAARNELGVTASGTYLWNGATVDAVRLRQYLDLVSQMAPMPLIVVRVEPGAPAGAVAALRETIGRAMRCDFQPA